MLMNHADSKIKRIFGRTDCNFRSVNENLSLVREIDPGKHIHKCCLAAAVLTEDRKDLAFPEGQVDAVIRDDLAESFRNVF